MTPNKRKRQFTVGRNARRVRFLPRRLRVLPEEDFPTFEEQYQNLDESPDSDGEDCEIHFYEERLDTQGELVCLRVGTKSAIESKKRKSHRACLVLIRTYDIVGELTHTRLEIQSQRVKKALQEVICSYLGCNFKTPVVTIYHPFKPLFHYRRELQAYADKCDDASTRRNISLCLRYVKDSLSREISLFDQAFTNESSNFEIEHEDLWIAYKPGDLIYYKDGTDDTLSRLRRFEAYYKDGKIRYWDVIMESIKHDGTDFGHLDYRISIEIYIGRVCIRDLKAFPLHFHPQQAQIRDALVQRGKLYVSHRGVCHRFFNGTAKFGMGLKDMMKLDVRHRVMLDTVAYHSLNSKELRTFNLDSPIFRTATEDHLQMKAEELMICYHEVYGYDLALKLWGIFSVANIRDVEFNSEAFNHLLLSSNKKQLISSLVMQHGNRPEAFDDYIRGKGKGLIFLLHGPPGVGKTFTAESVADYVRRPLFTVTAREMGHNLEVLLGLATQWNAVVLVDEADVFMQQRDLANFYRNDLVSSLLRVLEYFEGIMFLTTNRVETIDSAFQSRIHLSIAYPALSHAVRQELWRNWITRENSGSEPDWLTQVLLDNLANRNLNGREIKNAMQIAHTLSRSEKRRMHATDVFRALEADEEFRTSFQKDLEQRKAGDPQATKWQQEEHGSFLILRAAYHYFRDIARLLALGET